MTARISTREILPGQWEVSVVGKLAGEEVDAFETALEGLGPTLVLDLAELRGMDARGEAVLRRLRSSGAVFRGQSPFISLVLSLDPEGT